MAEKRECVFCGNSKLSKEHIFAQWLLKELNIIKKDVAMTHTSVIGVPLSNRKHSFSKLVNGLVCKECNNSWMSQLEGDCQNHIINLMNMVEIDRELDFLNKHNKIVAKWAFKNVILLNHATNYRRLVPSSHFGSLYSGTIPNGVFIDLAFCKNDSTIEWRQSPGSLVIKDKNIPLNTNTRRYNITFQIKKLLIKVSFYESSFSVFYEDDGAIRLFPQFGSYGTPRLFDSIDDFDIHGCVHEYSDVADT